MLAARELPQLDELRPHSELPPRYLSSRLLAELVVGRSSVSLTYLELRPLGRMRVSSAQDASAGFGYVLARCHSLWRLCGSWLLPCIYSPSSQAPEADSDPPSSSQQASALLAGLQSLPRLTKRSLNYPHSELQPVHLTPLPPALRSLTLNLYFWSGATPSPGSLQALQQAVDQGVRVVLIVYLSHDFVEVGWQWEGLWAVLAELPPSAELHPRQCTALQLEALSAAELQLLGRARCDKLVLAFFDQPVLAQLLQCIQAKTVVCNFGLGNGWRRTLPWSVLVLRPCITVVVVHEAAVLSVEDCSGSPPGFAPPWAVVLRQPQEGDISGLPLSQFQSGPCGCSVWRNSTATDAVLEAAINSLWWWEN